MTARKWFVRAAIVGTLLMTGVGSASAYTGYVCSTSYSPGNIDVNLGTYGYTYLTLYSGPDCTGNFVYTGYLCTVNAVSSVCTSYNWALFSYWSIPQITQELIE